MEESHCLEEPRLREQDGRRYRWHLRDLPQKTFVALVVSLVLLTCGVMISVAYACVSDRIVHDAPVMDRHDFVVMRRARELAKIVKEEGEGD